MRSDRACQARQNTPHGLAFKEVWPLAKFLQHIDADERTEFQLAQDANNRIWDADVYFYTGMRRFQIKTTGPLWPRQDGTLANYGQPRKELILELGKDEGVSNLGPMQGDLLGAEYSDCRRTISKKRLLRAAAVGLRDALEKASKYSRRPDWHDERGDVELIIYIWGLNGLWLSPWEFRLISRACRAHAPLRVFKRVFAFGPEEEQFQQLI